MSSVLPLPPNLTHLIQPADVGLIRHLKAIYRQKLKLRNTTLLAQGKTIAEVSRIDVMAMMDEAWDSIPNDEVVSYWTRAGFLGDDPQKWVLNEHIEGPPLELPAGLPEGAVEHGEFNQLQDDHDDDDSDGGESTVEVDDTASDDSESESEKQSESEKESEGHRRGPPVVLAPRPQAVLNIHQEPAPQVTDEVRRFLAAMHYEAHAAALATNGFTTMVELRAGTAAAFKSCGLPLGHVLVIVDHLKKLSRPISAPPTAQRSQQPLPPQPAPKVSAFQAIREKRRREEQAAQAKKRQ